MTINPSSSNRLPLAPPPRSHGRCGSTGSTISVATCKNNNNPGSAKMIRKSKQRVRFVDDEPNVHVIERVAQEDFSVVWFSSQDLSAFLLHTCELAALLDEDGKGSWCPAVLSVYRAFRANVSKSELLVVLAAAQADFDETTIGLEDLAVPAIKRDFHLRRRHLMKQVHRFQTMSLSSAKREHLIAETSRLASLVDRSFAIYTAHVLSETADEKAR